MDSTTTRRTALVTGASSGIGLELARQFAQHGYDLIIVAEDAGIDAAAADLRTGGTKVEAARVDLASRGGVDALVGCIRAMGRPLDAAVLNAGVGVGGPFLEADLQAELALINLNVVSVVHLTKHLLKDMAARGEGRLLFTSSIAAEMPAPFEAVYGASKAFVQSFAEALRNEMKDTDITITSLQPGPTDTNFFHRAGMDDTRVGAGHKDDPAEVARQGFEALMEGKDHVVAGSFKNKVQSALAQITPEPALAEMHRKLSEPGSADR